jgi:hypothetical protein
MNIGEIKNKYLEELRRAKEILNITENYDDKEDIINIFSNKVFYSLISGYSVQSKTPLSDKHLFQYFNFTPVSAEENCGDAKDVNNFYYEFKTSFTNKGNNLNIRQIRLWQNVDYYYCFFINEEDIQKSLFFKLSHEEMMEEVKLFGSATHGTSKANESNNNIEYSITIPVYNLQNKKTIRWRDRYLQGGELWN